MPPSRGQGVYLIDITRLDRGTAIAQRNGSYAFGTTVVQETTILGIVVYSYSRPENDLAPFNARALKLVEHSNFIADHESAKDLVYQDRGFGRGSDEIPVLSRGWAKAESP